jgi:sugar phosphate isomerase/epimerase
MQKQIQSRRRFLRNTLLGAAAIAVGKKMPAASSRPPLPQITMLNSMGGADFEVCARQHVTLGLRWLDLKDRLWGQTINDLSLENAARVLDIAQAHGLGVASFSTALCSSNLEEGEASFRAAHLSTLQHVLKVAKILRPQTIRLLSPVIQPFPANGDSLGLVERQHAWIFAVFREMIDRMTEAGQQVLIENEAAGAIFNTTTSIQGFFERLNRPGQARFTWDVQNFWEAGVFPSLDVYRALKPLIGCIHLKGGRIEGNRRELVWASSLDEASWPVAGIVNAAIADRVAPFICLNPSHGKRPPGWNLADITRRDVEFLRRTISAAS